MKLKISLVCLLCCFALACPAQTPKKKTFEVGLDVASLPIINYWLYAYIADKNIVNGISGVFVRYNTQRVCFRASANYYHANKELNIETCRDCYSGSTLTKATNLKVGFQYQVLKSREWLYAFSDLQGNSFKSEGNRQGGFSGTTDFTFEHKVNSYGLSTGLGAKLKLWKRLYLSPELSCATLSNKFTMYYVDRQFNTQTLEQRRTISLFPTARVLLTAKF